MGVHVQSKGRPTRGSAWFLSVIISSPQQEAQKIFQANHPMDSEVTKAKVRQQGPLRSGVWGLGAALHLFPLCSQLLGFGSALLDNVDPNPENYVGAGIVQTKALQVGCLLRLEPNAQAQVREGGSVFLLPAPLPDACSYLHVSSAPRCTA